MKSNYYRRLKKAKAFLKHPATRRVAILFLILAAIFLCHGKYTARKEERLRQESIPIPSQVQWRAKPSPDAKSTVADTLQEPEKNTPSKETEAPQPQDPAESPAGVVKNLLNGAIPSSLGKGQEEAMKTAEKSADALTATAKKTA